jgi:hypothetical protein
LNDIQTARAASKNNTKDFLPFAANFIARDVSCLPTATVELSIPVSMRLDFIVLAQFWSVGDRSGLTT